MVFFVWRWLGMWITMSHEEMGTPIPIQPASNKAHLKCRNKNKNMMPAKQLHRAYHPDNNTWTASDTFTAVAAIVIVGLVFASYFANQAALHANGIL